MTEDFRKNAHIFVDWMADYLENINDLPVKSQVNVGQILNQIETSPPQTPTSIEVIFADFKHIIMPGITHWQHPKFFAYFPSNSSTPSLLAEMLTATLGAQCMSWQTSPAAAELEERVMQWLAKMVGLPATFKGVIQGGASIATLCALLTAREKYTDFNSNQKGLSQNNNPLIVYCSTQTHSSALKAVRIAGIGDANLRFIQTDENYQLDVNKLQLQIQVDIEAGLQPLCIIAVLGSTSSGAVDPLWEITKLTRKYGIWLHVDAAYAGTALFLAEYKHLLKGIEYVDSFVFNPHKWMFTNFDCSAFFVKDINALTKTFSVLPEYLRTKEDDKVNNYRDWGIDLGRRFRALKLWFVIRYYGVEQLKTMIRHHIELANNLALKIKDHKHFEILEPISFNIICFRYINANITDLKLLNQCNKQLLENINKSGELYLTHTELSNKIYLRLVIAQTHVEAHHVDAAWIAIQKEVASKNYNNY